MCTRGAVSVEPPRAAGTSIRLGTNASIITGLHTQSLGAVCTVVTRLTRTGVRCDADFVGPTPRKAAYGSGAVYAKPTGQTLAGVRSNTTRSILTYLSTGG